jgi:aspartate/methionine/tyrosine aminotransferase
MVWDYSENEILITTGATEALYATMFALLNPNDEVIIFEPFYDGYPPDVMLAGGVPKYVTLHKPDFTFDPEELEGEITDKTKIIVLNTPHNPTGKVFGKEELQIIADLAVKYDLLVVADEVYEFLLFENAEHIPIASLENMRDRTITISSTGKTFGMTGWKIGFIKANKYYINAILKIRQWSTFAVNTPGQHAMAYGFEMFEDYLPEFVKLYSQKRDYVYEQLSKSNSNHISHMELIS